MGDLRKIRSVSKSIPTIEGAGVHLRRAFGYDQVPRFDPFLLLDDFRADEPAKYLPGFPWHPHRGIETITYVLEGEVEHGDSMGNKGGIKPGDLQWMTAGSGIIHQEMPKGDRDGRMGGFQLWANLPASRKMMEPCYRDVRREQIPEVSLEGGVRARIISGAVSGIRGPVHDIVIDPEYLDVSVPSHASFTHAIKRGHTAFAYVIEGMGYLDDEHNASLMRWSVRITSISNVNAAAAMGPLSCIRMATTSPSAPKMIRSVSCWFPAGLSASRLHGTVPS